MRALARRFAPDVEVYLRRRIYPLPESDVDDLVQSVFIVAWRRPDAIPEGDELPWLIGAERIGSRTSLLASLGGARRPPDRRRPRSQAGSRRNATESSSIEIPRGPSSRFRGNRVNANAKRT
jgi:hypothetical protein